MVYHRLDSSTSGEAPAEDNASRMCDRAPGGEGRYCGDRPSGGEGRNNPERPRNGGRDGDRYLRGSRGSRDERDDGRYSRSRDDRKDCVREKDKYYDNSRYSSDRPMRYRGGDRYQENFRYDEGPSRYSSERSRYHPDEMRYPLDDSRYDCGGPRYLAEDSRYSTEGSRYSEGSRYRGRGGDWYRYHRYDEGEGSMRHWKQQEDQEVEDEDEEEVVSSPVLPPEKEAIKNVFQNDGSFLEMFKKMQETKPAGSGEEPSPTPAEADNQPALVPPTESAVPKRPVTAVGKRRGGRVLPTGMVKKYKREEEEQDTPKDAWSLYMAEVRKYKEASCEEEGKTRPLVK